MKVKYNYACGQEGLQQSGQYELHKSEVSKKNNKKPQLVFTCTNDLITYFYK